MNHTARLQRTNTSIIRAAFTLAMVALLSACGATPYQSTAPTFNTNNAIISFDNKPVENSHLLGRVTLNDTNIGFTQSEGGSLALGLAIPLFGAAANTAYVTGLTETKGEALTEIASLDLAALSADASSSFCQNVSCQVVVDSPQSDLTITPAVSMLLKEGERDMVSSVLFYVSSNADPKWQGRYLVKLPEVLDYQKFKDGDNSQVEGFKMALTRGYKSLFALFMKDLKGNFNYASKENVTVETSDGLWAAGGKLLHQEDSVLILDTVYGIQSIDVSGMKVRKL